MGNPYNLLFGHAPDQKPLENRFLKLVINTRNAQKEYYQSQTKPKYLLIKARNEEVSIDKILDTIKTYYKEISARPQASWFLDLFEEVQQMRAHQKQYYRTRSQANLLISVLQERKTDTFLEVNNLNETKNPTLFGACDPLQTGTFF